MAEAAEESGKENFLSGRSDGRKFSEADRGAPAAGEATEKENTAAAGSGRPVVGRFQKNTESLPSTSATSGFSVWKDACFCSPPARHGRVYFQKEILPQWRSRLDEIKQGSVFSSCAGEASPDMFFLITYS